MQYLIVARFSIVLQCQARWLASLNSFKVHGKLYWELGQFREWVIDTL